jgi:hypothetical protein
MPAEGTVVLPCNCEHATQDEIYGKGRRLHNIAPAKTGGLAYCTVCAPNKQLTRNAIDLAAMPHIGFRGAVGRRPRTGKQVPQR